MADVMAPECSRHEQFREYTATLRERFASGLLSELQDSTQCVVWRADLDSEGKKKKVPYNPNHHRARASVKLPTSWGSLEASLHALETGNYTGLGFMLTPPFVMIDLDRSFDRQRGAITDPQAAEIIQSLNSYTEASPGDGLHVLAFGSLPGKNLHTGIELYGQGRFTTITTDHLAGTPTSIEHRQEALAALYNRFAPSVTETDHQNTRGVVGSGSTLSELPPEAEHDVVL